MTTDRPRRPRPGQDKQSDAHLSREERLAAQLRANLSRRKQAQRARASEDRASTDIMPNTDPGEKSGDDWT
ncbi:MAG: hypothetical protein MRY63_05965 [Neomegalonema sp.]|nr:hypothetical protein [Neomegalonema sp.]